MSSLRHRIPASRPSLKPDEKISRWLAAGVPVLGPVAAIAATMSVLALAIGGSPVTDVADQVLTSADWTAPLTWAALLLKIGASGLAFLPVAVAGYLAYGMAGRPAAIAGVLGGMAAMSIQGGVLAALAAGLIAGAATTALQRIPVRPPVREFSSALLATVATVGVLIVFVQPQLFALIGWLHGNLVWWEFHHTVLLGVVLGLMVCSDLGGAIGKAAIAFGAVGVSGADPLKFSPANMTIMAAVVAAGMVPPLAMTLATLVRRKLFTEPERAYGKISWLFGAAFLPEGALPFALADPVRVIPAGMAGGAVTGALVMTFGTTISVPAGGVFSIGQVGEPLLFAVAVIFGVLVAAAVVVALKSLRRPVDRRL